MSFIVIQPSDVRTQRPSVAPFSRCGPAAVSADDYRAIPRSLLGALLGGANDDDDVVFDEAPSLTPWQQHHLEQLRRQEDFQRQAYLQEAERRRRILAARRQQAELERQLEQARREKAIRLAWHQEQQRRAAVAHEYQRRVEAHKRRQQEEYALRVRQAQQARLAQQTQQKEIDWEKVAAQSLFGVIDLVQHLFGDEQAKTESHAEGKKREKTTEEELAEQAKRNEVDAMQVDQQEPATKPDEVNQDEVKQVEVEQDQDKQNEVKQAEVASEQSASTDEGVAPEQATPASEEKQVKADAQEQGRLVFTYPLPQDKAVRSNVKAQDIGVSYDQASHTIQLTGLWPNNSSSDSSHSTTVGSDDDHDESRGRKRSRSPKHSRVSDFDEKTGEEIVKTDENEEGFVEVPQVQTTTKSIRLPQDAAVSHLRAELTDEGFKVFV